MASASVAIIGLSCRLPGAASGAALLGELATARRFPPLPAERWDPDAFGPPPAARLLEDFELDFRAFRIPPAQIARMHRMERAALAALRDALVDAGLEQAGGWNERTTIHMAASTLGLDPQNDHMARVRLHETEAALRGAAAELSPEALEAALAAVEEMAPPITVDSLMTTAAMTAGRLANAFDLGGGHMAYDAGGASSLAAIAGAVASLETGECDLAIVGAVSPLVTATLVEAYRRRRLYRDAAEHAGQPRRGTLLGEGAVALVLEREDDARQKARRIYAVVRGVGAAATGRRGAVGGAEPAAQRAARLALEATRFAPATIDYVECQGAGLDSIDDAEQRALLAVYGDAARALPLVSCVPSVGYLGAAAGMVSVAAACLALERGERPAPAGEPILGDAGEGARRRAVSGPVRAVRRVAVSSLGTGQVAHHLVLARADDRRRRTSVTRRPAEEDRRVAIVGIGVVMPGAPDATALWRSIVEGGDAVRPIPRERWDAAAFMPAAARGQAGATQTTLAGLLPPLVADSALLRLPPCSLPHLDGSVLLTAQASAQALDDAGAASAQWDPNRVAVVVGHLPLREAEFTAERRALAARVGAIVDRALDRARVAAPIRERVLATLRRGLLAGVPEPAEETLDAMTSLTCAARVAARYDFRGDILAVDAACASSLVALHHGIGALVRGDVDAAVVAASAYNLIPEYYVALATLGALATGGSRPFDDGDGMVPAEGAGAIVIRRVADAVRDGQRIYAVVRGVAMSSDGRGTALLAPSTRGQQRALERAYSAAQLRPEQIDLLEAHGTGTRAGDAVELETYGAVFARRDPREPIVIGSIKSNVGHLSSAAGIAGIIKAALALHHRVLPPMRHSGRPSSEPALRAGGPLAISRTARAWGEPHGGGGRLAAVSAFGLGGINAHAILEEYVFRERRQRAAPPRTAPRSAARLLVDLAPLARPAAGDRPPGPVLLIGERSAAVAAVQHALEREGIPCETLALPDESIADLEARVRGALAGQAVGSVLDLSALAPRAAQLDAAAEALRAVRRATAIGRACYAGWETGGRWVVATAMGGGLGLLPGERVAEGGALTGFMKALKQELPLLAARVVDLDPADDAAWIAETLLAELALGGDRVEVGYLSRRRLVPVLRAAPLPLAAPPLLTLQPGAVVLFSGGGRGVVFECARALAQLGCNAVVTGRTPPARGDEPWLSLSDEAYEALRREELIAARRRDPSLTPARFALTWAARTSARRLHRNLSAARRDGLPIEYHVLDVNNASECQVFVRALRARLGRLDGIVHGAMVEQSRALPNKSPEAIEATVRTKVGALTNLLDAAAGEPLQLVCAFGSIAGRLGNRGQTDYAAANDAMAKVLLHWAQRHRDTRCVTIDWTAWADVGAAASERTAELLRDAGIEAISVAEGTRCFVEELTHGAPTHGLVLVCPERQAHDWPFIERTTDAAGRPPSLVDDRGQPLVAADWPLADAVMPRPGDERAFVERLFEPARDLYFADHKLEGTPVLPGAFAVELIAEAAALVAGGPPLREVRDFNIDLALRMTERTTSQLVRTEVRFGERRGDSQVFETRAVADWTLAAPGALRDRVHFRGTVVLGAPSALAIEGPAANAPTGGERSIFERMHAPVELGAPFHGIERVERTTRGARAVLRRTDPRRLFAGTSAPRFELDPLLLDAAFQVAAHWDALRPDGWVSIPVGFARLRVGTAAAGPLVAEAICTHESDDTCTLDVRVDVGGTPVLALEGLRLRRILPVQHAAWR